jgi:hypothetical protein
MNTNFFKPGQTIVHRDIWEGKIWSANPGIVIQDTEDILTVYRPYGIVSKRHTGLTGGDVTGIDRRDKKWTLIDSTWNNLSNIRLNIPGEPYSVLIFRNKNDNKPYWYINLEKTISRVNLYVNYTDFFLDLIIKPDLNSWYWEDEDELKKAVELGMISSKHSENLYAKGAEVRDLIMSGKSVFNEWINWRPDPEWKVPVLPEGWDII